MSGDNIAILSSPPFYCLCLLPAAHFSQIKRSDDGLLPSCYVYKRKKRRRREENAEESEEEKKATLTLKENVIMLPAAGRRLRRKRKNCVTKERAGENESITTRSAAVAWRENKKLLYKLALFLRAVRHGVTCVYLRHSA